MEKTLVILKPDAVRRQLAGEIISRFERKGLKMLDIGFKNIDRKAIMTHYDHVKRLPFYDGMIEYMTSEPSILIVLEGDHAVSVVRSMIGKTKSYEAQPGTIRGDYGFHEYENLVHASDSVESAEIEIQRFFG